MNISLIGPPGSGKGSQAAKLTTRIGFSTFSIGDLFRHALKEQTELGHLFQEYWDQGQLVPDRIVYAIVEEWLASAPSSRILFEGFPRTIQQAEFLEKALQNEGRRLDMVIFLQVSDSELLTRLSERVACKICRFTFNIRLKPFTACPFDKCQGEHLSLREDDKPELARNRLESFHTQTEPLINFYKEREKLVVLDGEQAIEKVFDGISRSLKAKSEELT